MRYLRAILIICAALSAMCLLGRGPQLARPSLAAGGNDAEPKPCAMEYMIACPSRPDRKCQSLYLGDCMGYDPEDRCLPDTTHLHFCTATQDCYSADGVECRPPLP